MPRRSKYLAVIRLPFRPDASAILQAYIPALLHRMNEKQQRRINGRPVNSWPTMGVTRGRASEVTDVTLVFVQRSLFISTKRSP